MADDDFTQPPNDGMNVDRLVRRDVQLGFEPDSLVNTVVAEFKQEHGLGPNDILSAAVVKKFRREAFGSGIWVVYYRITGALEEVIPED